MRKLSLIFLIILPVVTHSQDGIKFFEGTWAEILAMAKTENRLIFMDAYATWCGPCKRMAADVFPQKVVGDMYNQHFIPVKIDMEKGEGTSLAKLYNVRAYPTLLYINWKGELVHKAVGGRNAEDFIELGKEALDDTRNFRSIELAYLRNRDDVNSLIAYANALKQTYDRSYSVVISEFLKDKPSTLLLSETGWKIITGFADDPQSLEFLYLIKNRNDFYQMFGKEEVDKKIGEVVELMIAQAVRKNDEGGLDNLRRGIREINPENVEYYLALAEVQYYRRNSKWEAYAPAVKIVLEKGPVVDAKKLNTYAWDFYLNVDDQNHLKWMTSQVASMLKNDDEYAIHDTYAALLFKTRNYKQALKEARAAVELAKKEEAIYEDTLELIETIKKAMKK